MLEFIQTAFIIGAVIALVWAVFPAFRPLLGTSEAQRELEHLSSFQKIRSGFSRPNLSFEASIVPLEEEKEEETTPLSILDKARQSPITTTHIIRKWVHE